jgi:hypothetical protein
MAIAKWLEHNRGGLERTVRNRTLAVHPRGSRGHDSVERRMPPVVGAQRPPAARELARTVSAAEMHAAPARHRAKPSKRCRVPGARYRRHRTEVDDRLDAHKRPTTRLPADTEVVKPAPQRLKGFCIREAALQALCTHGGCQSRTHGN